MKRWLAGLALLSMACALHAAQDSTRQETIRASMLVKGTITVSDTGQVTGHTLYEAGKLPRVVVELLNRVIPTWRFHPAVREGHPVAETANMRIRVIATPVGHHRFELSLAGTYFDDGLPRSRQVHIRGHHAKPVYPFDARVDRAAGNVYVILRINRQGRVEKAAVQEVDLTTRGGPAVMAHVRDVFARSALGSVRNWRFAIPTTGSEAKAGYWDRRIVIVYRMGRPGGARTPYGQWQPYIPGPRRYIPWLSHDKLASGTAQPGGTLQILGQGLQRIDPPNG